MNENELFEIQKATKQEIIEKMEKELMLTQEQAECYFSFLLDNKEVLSEDEVIYSHPNTEGEDPVAAFMTEEMTYYVNLHRAGIYFIVFLMNLKVNPAWITLLDVVKKAFGEQIVVSLENEPDARCVLLTMAKNRKRGITIRGILNQYRLYGGERMECFNNHYSLCPREDGRCRLTEERIREIVDFLEREGAVKQKGFGRYYYQM